MENPKLIVIVGPTGAGKSKLAVKLAKKFLGEVISADSRQVYKGSDIGTGKITKKEMEGVPHHLLSVASPKRKFTVSQYRKLALTAIKKIFQKNKIPILCGGTAFYIRAVIDGIIIPEVKPDWNLRKKLEKKSLKELFQTLKKLDRQRAKTIDRFNPRRLIRALEIVLKTKKPIPVFKKNSLPYPVLILGIKISKKELEKRVAKRVEKMIKLGLEKEARKFSLPIIGYQEWSSPNPRDLIIQHTLQFAKRQMTWWKKEKRIRWIKSYRQAENLAEQFLQNIAD